ncbi:antirepressor protein Ant [Salmonella enterica subsp. salamae]|nr:antirepressor protein Ant [Salmonella enterica subsp. salamae]SQH40220.1 phage antirepressor protein [Salmonella enterica]
MNSIAILEAVNTSYVPFNGQQILTAMAAGVAYVAMRPIVENIGIDWAAQFVKLKKQSKKFGCCDIATPSNGGIQKMLCIPLKKLNGWLFSINPEKIRADIRDKLIQYQEECFTVLHDYWTKGRAEDLHKKTTVDERTPLRDAVNMLVSKRALPYDEAYTFVHQRFGVRSIEDLEPETLPAAIEYVHRLALEGELLVRQQTTPVLPAFPVEANFEYLTTVRAGQIVDIRLGRQNEIFISLESYRELSMREGYIAIHHDELRTMTSPEIVEICNKAAKMQEKWGRIYARS